MQNGEQRRVLIVRLGAMGDIIHALPAVSALRAAHPEWVLGWAVEPQWRALLAADSGGVDEFAGASTDSFTGADAGNLAGVDACRNPAQPLVDQVHTVPAKSWARRPLHSSTLVEVMRTRRELAAAGYDAAVDLQGAVRSALVARGAQPRRLLGEAAPREPAARWLFRERVPTRGVHVIEQAAEVLRALEGDALPLGLPVLPVDPAAVRWRETLGLGGEPFALLHPGAGWGAKRWPPERYAAVGAALARLTGVRVVVHVAPGERELGLRVAEGMCGKGMTPLLVAPSVGQLIELTRGAALAIGGDTGPLHVAAALGKPTVAIFGPTDPARNGPFHGSFRVLRDPASRRDHTRHADPEAGLLRIAPDAVVDAAVELLRSPAAVAR